MESLHENVSRLQEFLETILSTSFLPTDVFESRIRDTAYSMEDTIELVILKESESRIPTLATGRIKTKKKKKSKRKENFILPTPEEFHSYFVDFLVLTKEAMEIEESLDNFVTVPLSNHQTSSREAPGSKGTKVGLDEALNQILDQVTGQKPVLRFVPITGMGGIGKTTLARATYEAPETLRHFDVRLWVTVSQHYNIQEILRKLLPQAGGEDDRLIEYVHKHLKGRRYLIVLDDMWDEKVWDRVRYAFPDNKNGSRIILTTRSSEVASYVGSLNSEHAMQFMSEDQSWDLLRANVYGHGCCSPEFEDMGRMIAKRCKGLPLAIVVIAGLLKFNQTRDYWEQVARNSDEKATTSNDHLFEILSLSYTRLPPHLRACFLYMGIYKEDYEIKTKELVRLWAAEGFLKPKASRSMEEVAEECLEELVERSLVLVTTRRYNGKIRTCSVHDVIRELSITKAEEEKFHYHFTPSVDESTFRNVLAVQRRVSITDSSLDNFRRGTFFVTIHSLIEQNKYGSSCISIVQSLKLLRVLNKTRIETVFELSILCTLTNLRYLHFVMNGNSRILIPESISKLQNLETFIVQPSYGCNVVFVFPLEIWKLQRLRHITTMNYDFGTGDIEVPEPDQACPSVQTLFRVRNINLTRNFVKRIPNLKKLKLKNTNVEQENNMENLQYLHQLEELSISCDHSYTYPSKFVFPQNLKKLCLSGTKIPVENLSSIGLLPNLKMLELKYESVKGEEWELIEGEFLQLEHLKMEWIHIVSWRAESVHFPRLRKLVISRCSYLEEVPESIGEIDTLETLIVQFVRDEARRSVQRVKEIQQDMGNALLQVILK